MSVTTECMGPSAGLRDQPWCKTGSGSFQCDYIKESKVIQNMRIGWRSAEMRGLPRWCGDGNKVVMGVGVRVSRAAAHVNLSARPREGGDPEQQAPNGWPLDSRLRGNERDERRCVRDTKLTQGPSLG